MKLDKIVFTDRGRQIMLGSQFCKENGLKRSQSLPKSLSQRTALTKLSESGSMSAITRLTPQTFKHLTLNLDKKFIFSSPQKQHLMHVRFLNSQILRDRQDEKSHIKFIHSKANIISKKFLQSLQTLEKYNRIQEQKHKINTTRLQVNMSQKIGQGRNYINRIVHRHKEQQKRYKNMLRKMRNSQNASPGQF